jgi:hypothetical protein
MNKRHVRYQAKEHCGSSYTTEAYLTPEVTANDFLTAKTIPKV